ncbi:hypothetical protein IC232_04720 [Microvirga sp. BT688]|uniref:deazapurine DNA modification protein DpdA family protein n=1 Tax=Microvirga sp. TaxID=1873136 RepID=UPI0016862A57|nr:hypothetical protein [Microvirga sp.]MBD2745999.1 hypothetical protein [Microvirga sp.]
MLKFLLGLPHVMRGPLIDAARSLNAPVLISANALSIWKKDANGVPVWHGFRTTNLHHLNGLEAYLDSAGFVAASRYRGLPWSVDEYLDLCAAYPWRWAAAADLCVEPEVARNRDLVLDRISATVDLNRACIRGARERGILSRLMPVLQGWVPEDYVRCLERMPDLSGFPIVGVGSMCRRHLHGPQGILQVIETLDRELRGTDIRLHLFGLKGVGAAELRHHPRVATVDSQAYGTKARVEAREAGISKTNQFLARIMTEWYLKQVEALQAPAGENRHPPALLDLRMPPPLNPLEARLHQAREQMRELLEAGEIDWQQLHDESVLAFAFDEDDQDTEAEFNLAFAA